MTERHIRTPEELRATGGWLGQGEIIHRSALPELFAVIEGRVREQFYQEREPSPVMRYRVSGTDDKPGGDYYLRAVFTIAQARRDGYRVVVGSDGWTYGTHEDRHAHPGWTARPLSGL